VVLLPNREEFFSLNMERTPEALGPGVFIFWKGIIMAEDKEFRTHDQLIDKLINERKMTITNRNKAKKMLEREGYYNLINGYKDPFLSAQSQCEEFLPGTKMEELLAVYTFDRELRQTILKRLLHIETHVKSLIAYRFSEQYGHDNYLKYINFDTSDRNLYEKTIKLIAHIQRQVADRAFDPCIAHYLGKYAYIPLWVLNSVLTFGTISKYYSVLKPQDKMSVAKSMQLMSEDLENILLVLSSARNMCAHGNRLFCYRSKRPLIDLPIHKKMKIPMNASGKEYQYGKRDLFSVIIAMKMTLPKKEFENMTDNIHYHYKKMNKELSTISGTSILDIMGFPHDWLKQINTI